MTPKQARFVDEYLKDLSATRAAARAGYSEKTAYSQGQRLLKNVEIRRRIQEEMDQRAERTRIDTDYVLERLVEIDLLDVGDILAEDGGLLPLKKWPAAWRRYLNSMDVAEIYEGSGDARQVVGLLKKIRWPDKLKNLELLGKHIGVQAWRDRIETDKGLKTLEELLAELASDSQNNPE